ncbi:hypothetical protein C8R46DRAFT_1217449 [Mycena filopes]|nr:hypothetical protein C8R46DRAFT_1033390 [Mycena filopes]KAJ7169802.1 hypothetical protein C8R46DRAFT_1217449 [Mycena filopes]
MSSTTLHGLAVLENPRVIPKTKTTVFDGQLFLPSTEPALIGSFRYFNENNLTFAEVGYYDVGIRVARTTPTVEVYSQTLTPVDYHIMGDIFSLAPLGSPESFDLCNRTSIAVCGVATNINRDDATFEVDAEQYLAVTRSLEVFPARCLIPDTPRFKKYKPVPNKGKSVLVTGFLTGLERNDDKTVKHFIVDVDTVVFLGQPGPTAPKAEESPTKISQGTPASLKFTGFFGSQGSTDEPASKKRKTADDRAAEEAQDDKGEGSSNGRSRRTLH